MQIQAVMAHAMLSIPAVKGFEFGSGFRGSRMRGSEHNDLFDTNLRLRSNNSGGSLGGISTGETF
jgi:chorismate synthase